MEKIVLPNVRLSYCHVFQKPVFNGVEGGKFECTMLFPKENVELKEKVRQLMIRALLEKYESKDKIPAQFKKMIDKDSFGDSDRCALRDGDEKGEDAYAGMWSVKGANKMVPSTYSADKQKVGEDAGLFYSGSYADALYSVWVQDNSAGGKRINGNLLGLRFRSHGDPLAGGGGSAAADDFEDLDDAEAFDDDMDVDL